MTRMLPSVIFQQRQQIHQTILFSFSKSIQLQLKMKPFHLESPKNFDTLELSTSRSFRIPSKRSLIKANDQLFRTFLILFFFSLQANCLTSQENLIINGNFSQPRLLTQKQYFNLSVLGWKCKWICQIKDCSKGISLWLPQHKLDSNCMGQVLDLNSKSFNEVVSQDIQLKEGNYWLHFNYYYPVQLARKKRMVVRFNDHVLMDVRPQVDASFKVFFGDFGVRAKEGNNVLSFENLGYSADGLGFKINNVSLYRKDNNNFQQVLNEFVQDSSISNSFPGARVALRNTLSFLINFDRLELYIYHNRTYSYNMEHFLLSVDSLLNAKSDAPKGLLSNLNQKEIQAENAFIASINYKKGYITYASFSEDHQHPQFFDNINQSFIYFLPFMLLMFMTFKLFFRLFFNRPISLIFRKFEFWGIMLIMMFEGNIENLTFYVFAQLKIFFSQCYKHKLLNVFIIFLFFWLIFTVFGFLLWAKYQYGRRVRYILDEKKASKVSIWGIILDRGIICFLFGVVHQLMLDTPNLQLFVLMTLEISWIAKKGVFIIKRLAEQRWIVMASIMTGLYRVCFQVSIYLYQNYQGMRLSLNEQIHSYFIYGVLATSLFQLFIGVSYTLYSLFKVLSRHKIDRIKNSAAGCQEAKKKNALRSQLQHELVNRYYITLQGRSRNDVAKRRKLAHAKRLWKEAAL